MSTKCNINEDRNFTPFPDPRGAKPVKTMATKEEIVEKNKQPREFVIGDPHFYHSDIILTAPRSFQSVEEMNAYMIEKWNGVVDVDDTIFVLGDFFDFHNCDREQAYEILDQLNGNIILIKGNHDDHLQYFYDYGIQVIEYPILKDGFWFLSHEPMFVTEAAPYANIFAHVHLNPMYKTVSSRSFCASAERHDYTPVLLSEAKRLVRKEAMLSNALRPNNNVVLDDVH